MLDRSVFAANADLDVQKAPWHATASWSLCQSGPAYTVDFNRFKDLTDLVRWGNAALASYGEATAYKPLFAGLCEIFGPDFVRLFERCHARLLLKSNIAEKQAEVTALQAEIADMESTLEALVLSENGDSNQL